MPYFPLGDHTALFQGRILRAFSGELQVFLNRHAGRMFANIVSDYAAQTDWRVNTRLARELNRETFFTQIDADKRSVLAISTSCRIATDIAQIETYRKSGRYLTTMRQVLAFYGAWSPDQHAAITEMYSLKTDEHKRSELFARTVARHPEAQVIAEETGRLAAGLWQAYQGER
jgi:hypothetical protein